MVRVNPKFTGSIPKMHPTDWRIHYYWDAFRHENMSFKSHMFLWAIKLHQFQEVWKVLMF